MRASRSYGVRTHCPVYVPYGCSIDLLVLFISVSRLIAERKEVFVPNWTKLSKENSYVLNIDYFCTRLCVLNHLKVYNY